VTVFRKYFVFLFVFSAIILIDCGRSGNDQTVFLATSSVADYLGQTLPSDIPEIFAPGIVSTPYGERDFTMMPDGNEIYFSLQGTSGRAAIVMTKRIPEGWTKPEVAAFSGLYSDFEPCVSPDGKRLYFASNRPLRGEGKSKDVDIWLVERTDQGWGNPVNAGPQVNSELSEFYPSLTRDGTLYFCAKLKTSIGGEDIFFCRQIDGVFTEPENAGPNINTKSEEYNAFVAPDEDWIIFNSHGWGAGQGGGDMWISFRQTDGTWRKPVNLGEKINSPSFEFCPSLSPDGKFLFFTSNRRSPETKQNELLTYDGILERLNQVDNGSQNIFWVSAEFIKTLQAQVIE